MLFLEARIIDAPPISLLLLVVAVAVGTLETSSTETETETINNEKDEYSSIAILNRSSMLFIGCDRMSFASLSPRVSQLTTQTPMMLIVAHWS